MPSLTCAVKVNRLGRSDEDQNWRDSARVPAQFFDHCGGTSDGRFCRYDLFRPDFIE
jgi:hypothetical protein